MGYAVDANRVLERNLTTNTDLSKTEIHNKVIDRNDQGVRFLLSDVAHLNTPLGKKLREGSHQFLNEQTPDELREHIKAGKKVMITTEVASKGRHMIHVGIAQEGKHLGKLIALSEQGKPVLEITEKSKFNTITFRTPQDASKRADRKQHLLNILKRIPSKEAKNYQDFRITST